MNALPLLSTSTKIWKCHYAFHIELPCHPCHIVHHNVCPSGTSILPSLCCTHLKFPLIKHSQYNINFKCVPKWSSPVTEISKVLFWPFHLELCVTRSEDNEHVFMEIPGFFSDFFWPLIADCYANSGKLNFIKICEICS